MLDIIVVMSRLSPLVAGIFTMLMGLFVLVKDFRQFRNRVFFAFCCLLFFWALGCYIQSNTLSYSVALVTDKMLYCFAVFFPVSLVALVNSFLKKNFKYYIIVSAFLGILLLISNFFGGFRTGVTLSFGARYVTEPALGWYLFLVFFTLISNLMLWEIYKKIKNTIGSERKRFIYLFGDLNILIVGGVCYFLLILIQNTPFVASVLNLFSSAFLSVFSIMMTYAITKHELMGIKVIINRSAAYVVTAIIFMTGYFSLVWIYSLNVTKLEITPLFLVCTVLYGGVAVGLYFHRVQRYLQTSAYKKFLKLHYDFEKVLQRTSQQLVHAQTTDDVLSNLLTLQDSLEVGVSIAMIRHTQGFDCYQLALGGSAIAQVDGVQGLGTRRFIARFPESHDLLQVFEKETSPVIFFNDLDLAHQSLLKEFQLKPGSVCLIMKPMNQLQAVFVIGAKLSEEAYNIQDVVLFEIVVNQAVLVFERIEKIAQLAKSEQEMKILNQELEQLNFQLKKKVEQEVSTRNKAVTAAQSLAHKATMSTLTAGISHEIQNPITSIKANVENLFSRLSGNIGEDRYPWNGRLDSNSFLMITSGDEAKSTRIFSELVARGFATATGEVSDNANPFYDELTITLGDDLAEFSEAVTQRVGEAFKQRQVLEYLQLVSRESLRVVSITNAMLQYGAAKGVGQEAFSKLSGFSAEKSAKLWQELVDHKYLDPYGGLLSRFSPNDVGFTLELSEEFLPFEVEIIHILGTLPGAQKTVIDPGLPLEHAIQLKRTDMSRAKIQVEMTMRHTLKVLGDQNRLFQVFNILISNAIEAMDREECSGKVLKLIAETKNVESGVCISIQDNGCGMDEETLRKAKDPFFTTKGTTGGKNAGLGVSILFDIVENHGGTVEIQSEIGVGTVFTLFFPAAL